MLFILFIHNITLCVPRTESYFYSNLSLEVQVPTLVPELVILTGTNKQLRGRCSLSRQLHLVICSWFQLVILELQLFIKIAKQELTAMLANCPSKTGVNRECCNVHHSSDVGKPTHHSWEATVEGQQKVPSGLAINRHILCYIKDHLLGFQREFVNALWIITWTFITKYHRQSHS